MPEDPFMCIYDYLYYIRKKAKKQEVRKEFDAMPEKFSQRGKNLLPKSYSCGILLTSKINEESLCVTIN